MGHGIIKPIDQVYSTEEYGYSWHGLDRIVNKPSIELEDIKEILPPIIEVQAAAKLEDGSYKDIQGRKILLADYSSCRDNLESDMEPLVPLHIPKDSYGVISNQQWFECLQKSIEGTDCKITSAMTINGGLKFIASAKVGDNVLELKRNNGSKDRILMNLVFATGHDGTLSGIAYDSGVRPICQNTFNASLLSRGDINLKVRHTKNADIAIENLPAVLNAILQDRVNLKEVLEYLDTCKVDQNEALAMAAGYFIIDTDEKKLSTRSVNAATEIVTLFGRGAGNSGESLYDLWNGATDYWTNGEGTGKKSDSVTKRYKANFGLASDHKSRFLNLLADEDRRNVAKEIGKEALAEALSK
jgi:hypothetical protein